MTRLVTFNVCGIRALLSRAAQWVPDHSLETMFRELNADIVCFQETKIALREIPRELGVVEGFTSIFTCVSARSGYAGVALYVRNSIRIYRAEEGLTGWLRPNSQRQPYRMDPETSICMDMYPEPMSEQEGLQIDQQARALTIDIGVCVIIGLYCPADSQGNMSEYRDTFFQLLDWRVNKLREQGREVIVMGDLNVSREPLDSPARVQDLKKQDVVITREEWLYGTIPRKAVNDWVFAEGFVDTGRKFHPTRKAMCTCWDQRKNCRASNFGSRIDYIISSAGLKCVAADILPDLVGSDHCPVYADFDFGELDPQKGQPLPPLAKRAVDHFPNGISSFIQRGSSALKESAKRKLEASGDQSPSSPVKKQASVSQLFAKRDTSWQNTSKKKSAPLCKHREPCVLKTAKVGKHKGQAFWTCARPGGEKGNTESNCNTFQWFSDGKPT